MISPAKREREKRRREKQQNKMAMQSRPTAVLTWPPLPGRSPNWPEERTQRIIDELVHLVGPQPAGTLCGQVSRIAANPGDLQGYRTLGQELLSEGAIEAALGVFTIVVNEFPHHPLGPWKYAVCLRTRGDVAESREWMQRALRRSVELPRSIDPSERGEFERDAQLAGLQA